MFTLKLIMKGISQSFRCFDEVARRGSMRKAAETLHLTAAAVNQQILNLEATVGVPLFDRLPRGVKLTTAGEIVLGSVRRCQRDFENALAQVEDLRALRRGHVDVGVSHSTAEYVLPQVIEVIRRYHPGITFSVRSANGEALLQAVAHGEIDVAYCLRRTPPHGVVEVRSFPQPLGVVIAPGHALAASRLPLRLRDCMAHPLALLSADTELRVMLDEMDPRVTRHGRPLVETTSVAMVRRIVAAGEAVGFLIAENVAQEVEQGKLCWLPLKEQSPRAYSCVYQRTGYTPAVSMGLFLQQLQSAVEQIRLRERQRQPLPVKKTPDGLAKLR